MPAIAFRVSADWLHSFSKVVNQDLACKQVDNNHRRTSYLVLGKEKRKNNIKSTV